jgi:hypothetical protein
MERYGQGVGFVCNGQYVGGDGCFEAGHFGDDPLGEKKAVFIGEHKPPVVFQAFGEDFGGGEADAAEGFDGVDPDLAEG